MNDEGALTATAAGDNAAVPDLGSMFHQARTLLTSKTTVFEYAIRLSIFYGKHGQGGVITHVVNKRFQNLTGRVFDMAVGNVIGYARASTRGQSPESQIDALVAARAITVFQEHASGATQARARGGSTV
jgi:hypothetical protein